MNQSEKQAQFVIINPDDLRTMISEEVSKLTGYFESITRQRSYTPIALAKILGVSKHSIYKWCDRGWLNYKLSKKAYIISLEDVKAFFDSDEPEVVKARNKITKKIQIHEF